MNFLKNKKKAFSKSNTRISRSGSSIGWSLCPCVSEWHGIQGITAAAPPWPRSSKPRSLPVARLCSTSQGKTTELGSQWTHRESCPAHCPQSFWASALVCYSWVERPRSRAASTCSDSSACWRGRCKPGDTWPWSQQWLHTHISTKMLPVQETKKDPVLDSTLWGSIRTQKHSAHLFMDVWNGHLCSSRGVPSAALHDPWPWPCTPAHWTGIVQAPHLLPYVCPQKKMWLDSNVIDLACRISLGIWVVLLPAGTLLPCLGGIECGSNRKKYKLPDISSQIT